MVDNLCDRSVFRKFRISNTLLILVLVKSLSHWSCPNRGNPFGWHFYGCGVEGETSQARKTWCQSRSDRTKYLQYAMDMDVSAGKILSYAAFPCSARYDKIHWLTTTFRQLQNSLAYFGLLLSNWMNKSAYVSVALLNEMPTNQSILTIMFCLLLSLRYKHSAQCRTQIFTFHLSSCMSSGESAVLVGGIG